MLKEVRELRGGDQLWIRKVRFLLPLKALVRETQTDGPVSEPDRLQCGEHCYRRAPGTRSGVRSRASGARKLRPPTGTDPPIRPCGGILLGTLLRNPREQSTDFGLPVAPVSPQRAD